MQEPNRTKLRERATGINGAPRVNSLHIPSPPLPLPSHRGYTRVWRCGISRFSDVWLLSELCARFTFSLSLLLSPNQPSSLLFTNRASLVIDLSARCSPRCEQISKIWTIVAKSSNSSSGGSSGRDGSAITIPAQIGRDVAKFEAAS